jgi:hypothetical protein
MSALVDVTWRACACGHAGLVHRPSALGLALYGGLGRCELKTCGCDLFRPHGQSRYALVWHAKLTHRPDPRDTAGYAPPVLVPGLETISAEALPHLGDRNAPYNFWHGGPGHEITHKRVVIDRCGCGKYSHCFDDPRAPQVRELADLLWWSANNTKAADLLELAPVPPMVDDKPDPTPPVTRNGKAWLTVTDDNAGDPLQQGERYVLDLSRTELRMTVEAFMRPTSLLNEDETALELLDVPQLLVTMHTHPDFQTVQVKVGDALDQVIDGSGRR